MMFNDAQIGSDILSDSNFPNTHISSNVFAERNNRSDAVEFLSAIWRSTEYVNQVGLLSKVSGYFTNKPVSSVDHAIELTYSQSKLGLETYFATAEYKTTANRLASNAAGAYAFWVDIDCGEKKAKADKGYLTKVEAQIAWQKFCKETDMPEPTHIVNSGNGLHIYWVMDRFAKSDKWLSYAKKLKTLTQQLSFLADDSRTSDLASVLRVPGTMNHKYNPPKLVTLQYASDNFIEQTVLFEKIDSAYNKFCNVPTTGKTDNSIQVDFTGTRYEEVRTPNLISLASALAVLDPDCEERVWKLYRIAPMARAARNHPEYKNALYKLAKSWSRGELQSKQSLAWNTRVGHGKCGKDVFDSVWNRFFDEKPSDGIQTTLGSIYRDAREAGWVEEAFQIVDSKGGK